MALMMPCDPVAYDSLPGAPTLVGGKSHSRAGNPEWPSGSESESVSAHTLEGTGPDRVVRSDPDAAEKVTGIGAS
eukprot:12822536-Heterocapsa_arctica.AAC.1